MADRAAAADFVARHARVLDRRRHERLFEDGEADPVLDALAAYRNRDGGFGHALEPDGRGAGSQPAAIALALKTMHECDAWEDDLVEGVLHWLRKHEPEGGGAMFVHPSIEGRPAAPWWQPEPGLPASLVTTGPIAGLLIAHEVEDFWVDRAEDWVLAQLEAPRDLGEYQLRGALDFLEHAPDEDALERLRPLVEANEAIGPLDAPALHAEQQLADAREELDAAQLEDGGWMFAWPEWNPAATLEWRGSITVDALLTLRDQTAG